MADIFDKASDLEEIERQHSLQVHNSRPPAPKLPPAGYCQNPFCGADFGDDDPRLFCGSKCAEQYRIYINR